MNTARNMSFEETVLTSIFGTATPTGQQMAEAFGAPAENIRMSSMEQGSKFTIFAVNASEGAFQSATFILDFKTAQCVIQRRSSTERNEKSAKQTNCKDWSKLLSRAMAA